MTSSATTSSDAELELLFQHVVSSPPPVIAQKDIDIFENPTTSSQMPTPPQTPVTPPPPLVFSTTCSENGEEEGTQTHTDTLPPISTKNPQSPLPRADTRAEDTVVSVSTSFHPSAGHCGALPPDLVLLSADSVFFYVHSAVLSAASRNSLGGFLPSPGSKGNDKDKGEEKPHLGGLVNSGDDEAISLVMLPEPSPVLNIILHFVYNVSPAHHSPPFNVIVQAIDRMNTAYGIDIKSIIQGSALGVLAIPPHISTLPPKGHGHAYTHQPYDSPLFTLLAAHAPLYPIEVYALAASIDLFPLAQVASAHLHGLDLSPVDDHDVGGNSSSSSSVGNISGKLRLTMGLAQKMGGVYLMRLMGLHRRRVEVLRAAVCVPPGGHLREESTVRGWMQSDSMTGKGMGMRCTVEDQAALKRAWALAAAYIVCTAGADFSAQLIDSTLRPLAQHVQCAMCRRALEERIEFVKREWGMAPRTI